MSSLAFPRLNRGRVHAGCPAPSKMSKPTAKMLTAAEAPLSTNSSRKQPTQVFPLRALEREFCPGHFEVLCERFLPSDGAPSRGASRHRLPFRKRSMYTEQRLVSDGQQGRKSFFSFLPLLQPSKCSHLHCLQHFSARSSAARRVAAHLGAVQFRRQQHHLHAGETKQANFRTGSVGCPLKNLHMEDSSVEKGRVGPLL